MVDFKGPFQWDLYLRANRADPVPSSAFHARQPRKFTKGMALEVVDKKNPSLIRPATVIQVEEFDIKILFIGWDEKYAYWIEDDRLLYNFCSILERFIFSKKVN